jgi:hypothetical protein
MCGNGVYQVRGGEMGKPIGVRSESSASYKRDPRTTANSGARRPEVLTKTAMRMASAFVIRGPYDSCRGRNVLKLDINF